MAAFFSIIISLPISHLLFISQHKTTGKRSAAPAPPAITFISQSPFHHADYTTLSKDDKILWLYVNRDSIFLQAMYKLNILKGLPWFHFLIDDLYVIPIYVLPHFMKHMDIGFRKLLLVNMNTKNNKSNLHCFKIWTQY